MHDIESLSEELHATPRVWCVTGCAGFIGSNLIERLLLLNQKVIGLDNFSTGFRKNLAAVQAVVGDRFSNFNFIEGSIEDLSACEQACDGADVVLHQAARGSVPKSIEDPLATHRANVDGMLNMLHTAKQHGIRRFIYASSSSVYGDSSTLPKKENHTGNPLSPYAVSKFTNELYGSVFARCYDIDCIGLRYFNVFGKRQDPNGPYAAVIPKWIAAVRSGAPVQVYGDGLTTRDFTYIDDVIQINLLAAMTENKEALNRVYNVACGHQTSLNDLLEGIVSLVKPQRPPEVSYEPFRAGDIRHSLACIEPAQDLLRYHPAHTVQGGLRQTVSHFLNV